MKEILKLSEKTFKYVIVKWMLRKKKSKFFQNRKKKYPRHFQNENLYSLSTLLNNSIII